MVARRVRWRSGLVRRPPVRRSRRWSSRATRSDGASVLRAGRGQLDGQRNPVEATADLLDVVPRAGRIERHETACARSSNNSAAGSCGSSGPTVMSLFAADAERFPGRGEHLDRRGIPGRWRGSAAAAPSMTCSQLSRTSSAERDCRAVITDWVRVRPGFSLMSRTSATARGTSLGCGDAGQFDEPAPHRRDRCQPCAAAEREPGLADASRPDQGDDGRMSESAADGVELLLTADEAPEPEREVAAAQVLRLQLRMPTLVELQDAKCGESALEPVASRDRVGRCGRAVRPSPPTPGSGRRARRRRCAPRR